MCLVNIFLKMRYLIIQEASTINVFECEGGVPAVHDEPRDPFSWISRRWETCTCIFGWLLMWSDWEWMSMGRESLHMHGIITAPTVDPYISSCCGSSEERRCIHGDDDTHGLWLHYKYSYVNKLKCVQSKVVLETMVTTPVKFPLPLNRELVVGLHSIHEYE